MPEIVHIQSCGTQLDAGCTISVNVQFVVKDLALYETLQRMSVQ